MGLLIFIPFILQAIVIGVDEVVFHLKRGLPKWERIGHPLDTLSVIACLLFVVLVPYEPGLLKYYVGLAVFSCLLITKDEFVHKHHCPAEEQWLHAILFVNHSILLTSMGLMWPRIWGGENFSWMPEASVLKLFLSIQGVGITLFCLYQILYWNVIYAKKSRRERS